jgi:hypothetical protein
MYNKWLMQKYISFVITAAVLLTALVSVALYTVHTANAQSNMTNAGGAKNMTKASNMTGATGNTTGIHTANPASLVKPRPSVRP